MVTQEELKYYLDYDKDVGVFTWKVSSNPNRIKVGTIAGSNCHGYVQINIHKKSYRAHRLAWLWVYGVWPKYEIDHIDHNRSNNKIDNLRDVTKNHNAQNQIKPHKKDGLLGVHFHKRLNKYAAQIRLDGKNYHLGYFENKQDAHERYLVEKRKIHVTNTL